ncbi:MAG: ATP-dependent Clp protease ATP-binding subunit ClpC [Solirubrobacteraceae bacterium]|nr:ATP-dependent Clp protease ATP-binding subunit ClpC [Solirubrobacteraceae bacterium]
MAEASTAADALRKVKALRRELDVFEREQVARALAQGGNFSTIARDLGVTRQAVHRRFRSLAAGEEPLHTSADARRVLQLAREEAAALAAPALNGSHIVLAILRAADLPAASVLRRAGATLDRARTQVEAATPREPLFRRTATAGGDELRRLLAAAANSARARGEHQIEVEHLLLGFLEDDNGDASRTIRALGMNREAVAAELVGIIGARRAD